MHDDALEFHSRSSCIHVHFHHQRFDDLKGFAEYVLQQCILLNLRISHCNLLEQQQLQRLQRTKQKFTISKFLKVNFMAYTSITKSPVTTSTPNSAATFNAPVKRLPTARGYKRLSLRFLRPTLRESFLQMASMPDSSIKSES